MLRAIDIQYHWSSVNGPSAAGDDVGLSVSDDIVRRARPFAHPPTRESRAQLSWRRPVTCTKIIFVTDDGVEFCVFVSLFPFAFGTRHVVQLLRRGCGTNLSRSEFGKSCSLYLLSLRRLAREGAHTRSTPLL